MPSNNSEIEKKLWDAADELRANSKLRSSEYSTPVLGLVFLKWADHKFSVVEKELEKKGRGGKRRREIGKADYQARGVMYLPKESRFSHLTRLPEKSDIGKAINDAMKAIEDENEDLRGVLPTTYHRFDNRVLFSLLRIFNSIPMDVKGDVFGKVYEYFLGKFAMAEGQRGGEFFTPTSIVRLIVEIIEPFHGRIYDPACGSGGMFVQSARFVQEHKKNPSEEISVYGQESKTATVQLCKMNLAVHGLSGDIREGNTYYEDIHESSGKFDFVMANPPFNVDRVDKDRIRDDPRFCFGIPTVDNANYLWIQVFINSLNNGGRAGFVMANSACAIGGSELEIRKRLLATHTIDVIIEIESNFFYTVTLPCTLWFVDKRKIGSERENKILLINAKGIYRQIDRAHREFTPSQIQFISNIVRMYRSEEPRFHLYHETNPKLPSLEALFPNNEYRDIPGLCSVLTLEEIKDQNNSLHPSRHVGIADNDAIEEDVTELLQEFREDFTQLNEESMKLAEGILRAIDRITKD